MQASPDITVFTLNADFLITSVDEGWLLFAQQNEAPHLTQEAVLALSIWDFIYDRETRYLYREIFTKVLSRSTPVKLDFRCDSPGLRRFMELVISPRDTDQLELRSVLLRHERREPVVLEYLTDETAAEMLKMCSYCKKVEMPRRHWVEVEEAINELKLFAVDSLPKVTHGACPACAVEILKRLED